MNGELWDITNQTLVCPIVNVVAVRGEVTFQTPIAFAMQGGAAMGRYTLRAGSNVVTIELVQLDVDPLFARGIIV